MDVLQGIYDIIQSQGIIAGLLLIQIWKNSKERKELIGKNCELIRFLMHCYDHKLREDGEISGSEPDLSKPLNLDDPRPGGSSG